MEITDVSGRRSVLHNAQTKYKNESYTYFIVTASVQKYLASIIFQDI